MVTKLIVDRRPDEVVHVYDHDWRPITRTDMYPGYKAARPPEPEDLTPQFALLARGARPHRHAPGPDRGLGGRGRDRRLLHRGHRGRPDRHRQRRPRPDPAGARPVVRLLFTVRGVSDLGRVRRGGRAREVRRARRPLRRVRDPARRPVRRPARRPRRRREDRPRPGRRVPVDRRDARGRGRRRAPRIKPARPGQPARFARLPRRRCSSSCP